MHKPNTSRTQKRTRVVQLKFPILAIFFLCISFIFFIIWLVMTYLLNTIRDTLQPLGSTITNSADNASFQNILTEVPMAFGIICCIFFVVGIILIFVLDSWSDEPEYYYRE